MFFSLCFCVAVAASVLLSPFMLCCYHLATEHVFNYLAFSFLLVPPYAQGWSCQLMCWDCLHNRVPALSLSVSRFLWLPPSLSSFLFQAFYLPVSLPVTVSLPLPLSLPVPLLVANFLFVCVSVSVCVRLSLLRPLVCPQPPWCFRLLWSCWLIEQKTVAPRDFDSTWRRERGKRA